MAEPCVFCEIVAGREPAEVLHRGFSAIIIRPLKPVVEGHVLALPRAHVRDAAESPVTTGRAIETAAHWARDHPDLYPAYNLITSAGAAATQSVFHLHWHLIPRAENDGLALPWYSGKGRRRG